MSVDGAPSWATWLSRASSSFVEHSLGEDEVTT